MAHNPTSSSTRKKTVSQKRVAIVLASLVGTMTLSAGMLLFLENGPLGATPFQAAAVDPASVMRTTTPLQTSAWDYIIVYESGDSAGCAASFADGRVKGVGTYATNAGRQKANFHFVVDNAESKPGALEGELEVGSSWLNQGMGAPHAGWPDPSNHTYTSYKNAIGICVVGDLHQKPFSDAQNRSVVQLIRELQQQLRIPKDKIRFQWELPPHDAPHATQAQKDSAESIRQALD